VDAHPASIVHCKVKKMGNYYLRNGVRLTYEQY
jgi:hypothetical protein